MTSMSVVGVFTFLLSFSAYLTCRRERERASLQSDARTCNDIYFSLWKEYIDIYFSLLKECIFNWDIFWICYAFCIISLWVSSAFDFHFFLGDKLLIKSEDSKVILGLAHYVCLKAKNYPCCTDLLAKEALQLPGYVSVKGGRGLSCSRSEWMSEVLVSHELHAPVCSRRSAGKHLWRELFQYYPKWLYSLGKCVWTNLWTFIL